MGFLQAQNSEESWPAGDCLLGPPNLALTRGTGQQVLGLELSGRWPQEWSPLDGSYGIIWGVQFLRGGQPAVTCPCSLIHPLLYTPSYPHPLTWRARAGRMVRLLETNRGS